MILGITIFVIALVTYAIPVVGNRKKMPQKGEGKR